jgi:tetratricopeptide (TPR) repeat protein
MPHDSIEIAVQLHDRACHHKDSGLYKKAWCTCRRSLRLIEKSSGPGHPDVANVLNTLGSIQQDLGDYGHAESSFRRSVSIMEAITEDDPDIRRLRVQSASGLAGILRVQGRYGEAEPLFVEALRLAEASFGPTDPEVSFVLNDLAVLYKYTGEFARAEKLYRRALRIAKSNCGPDDPQVATIYHNLGGLEHARGRYAKAEPYARRSVQIREKALGPDHLDVAALASLLDAQGKHEEAEQLYRRVLAVFERTHDAVHYDVAVNLNNLAALCYAQGRYAEAEPLYRRALEEILGPDHPDVAMTLNNLAALCKATGSVNEARSLYGRALDNFIRTLGDAGRTLAVRARAWIPLRTFEMTPTKPVEVGSA